MADDLAFDVGKNASQHSPGASRLTSFVQKLLRNVCRSAPVTVTLDQSVSSTSPQPDRSRTYCKNVWGVGSDVILFAVDGNHRVLRIVDHDATFVPAGQAHQFVDVVDRRQPRSSTVSASSWLRKYTGPRCSARARCQAGQLSSACS